MASLGNEIEALLATDLGRTFPEATRGLQAILHKLAYQCTSVAAEQCYNDEDESYLYDVAGGQGADDIHIVKFVSSRRRPGAAQGRSGGRRSCTAPESFPHPLASYLGTARPESPGAKSGPPPEDVRSMSLVSRGHELHQHEQEHTISPPNTPEPPNVRMAADCSSGDDFNGGDGDSDSGGGSSDRTRDGICDAERR